MSVMRRRMMMAPPRMGYVEGMAVHLDGIYNTPAGHGDATEWTNLAGGVSLSVVRDAVWVGNGLNLSSNLDYSRFNDRQAYVIEQEPSITEDDYTIEMVVSWGEPRWAGVLLSTLGETNFYRYIVVHDDTHKLQGFGSLTIMSELVDHMLLSFSLVHTLENNKITYYANGTRLYQGDDNTVFTGKSIVIGGSQTTYSTYPGDNPYYPAFPGIIHGLRVYNRALGEDEIIHNHAVDKERFGL